MRKRIMSGVILTCVLVPTIFWARDMITGSCDSNKAVRAAREWVDKGIAWSDDKTAAAYEAEIDAEDAKLAADADEVAAANDPDDARVRLLNERHEVLEDKKKHLSRLNAKQLASEEHKLMKVRDEAAQKQWASTQKIAALNARMTRYQRAADEKQMAQVVNAFLDAVEGGKAVEAAALCVSELKPKVTKAKVAALARAMPSGGFGFKEVTSAREYKAMFGDRAMLTLVLRDGRWRVSEC